MQRTWVQDDDRSRGLLASVSLSFPIGGVMLLETGGENVGGWRSVKVLVTTDTDGRTFYRTIGAQESDIRVAQLEAR